MPRKDFHHNAVKNALMKDGWNITHDPYVITFGVRHAFVDLGAERAIAAQKDGQLIAVEVKSFVGTSTIADMEQALGQYLLYRSWMKRMEPQRHLYLAINQDVATDVFDDITGKVLVEDYALSLLVIDIQQEVIAQWRH